MEREKLGSRLGFILLSVSCAIGIGNIWKFPYMVGQNGGGIFVLVYLVFLVILGLPIMTMEFSMGRFSQKSPVRMFGKLSPKGEKTKWKAHGYTMLGGNVLIMMYYTVITAWLLIYTVKMLSGDFLLPSGTASIDTSGQFSAMTQNPWLQIATVAIVCILGVVVCMLGVSKSLEKVNKVMMLSLFVLMIVMAVNSLFLSGADEGLSFYLVPDFSRLSPEQIPTIITGAMSQAFFTLSLGMGSMAIFGSYIDKERSLLGESARIAVLDTIIAIMAGIVIFPACFTYDIQPNEGPSLIFLTLPQVFAHMPLGIVWGTIFFVCLCFAALSTIFAVFENIFACIIELTGWSRIKTCLIAGAGIFLLSIPCVLGFNLLSGFTPLGAGSSLLDLEDFIASYLFLPISSLFIVIFCTTKLGWGMDNYIAETNQGKGLKIGKVFQKYIKYVLPVLMAIFVVANIVVFFLS